jgi:hypothetical protein
MWVYTTLHTLVNLDRVDCIYLLGMSNAKRCNVVAQFPNEASVPLIDNVTQKEGEQLLYNLYLDLENRETCVDMFLEWDALRKKGCAKEDEEECDGIGGGGE